MASPFPCSCGAEKCFNEIKGFKHLSPEIQDKLAPNAAPFIQKLHQKTLS